MRNFRTCNTATTKLKANTISNPRRDCRMRQNVVLEEMWCSNGSAGQPLNRAATQFCALPCARKSMLVTSSAGRSAQQRDGSVPCAPTGSLCDHGRADDARDVAGASGGWQDC